MFGDVVMEIPQEQSSTPIFDGQEGKEAAATV